MKPSRRFGSITAIIFIFTVAAVIIFINSNAKPNTVSNFFVPIALLLLVTSVALYFGAVLSDQYYKKIDPRVKEIAEEEKLREELDDRSKHFLDTPITTLWYANVNEIENIYNTHFGHDIVEKITSEESEETQGEVGGKIPNVGGLSQSGKDVRKVTKSIKPHQETILNKFFKYQRSVILRRQVNLNLQLVNMNFEQIIYFDDAMNWLYGIGLTLINSGEELNSKRNELFEKAAREALKELQNVKDLVLMEEKFQIAQDEKNYICTFFHPANEYLVFSGTSITIRFLIPKDEIVSKADFDLALGKVMQLRVFGKVLIPLDESTNNWELVIKPIAVY